MDPNLAVGLLALGMFCIYVELNNPGTVLPDGGVIAIVTGGIAAEFAPGALCGSGTDVTAFVLFAWKRKSPHGVLGIGGVVALTLGSLFLVDGPIQEMRVHLSTALAISLPLGAIHGVPHDHRIESPAGKRASGMEG